MSLLDVVVPGAGSAVQAVTKILTLCQQMKEGQDACTRVHARLQTVLGELQRLEARKQLPPSEAVVVYADVLTRYLQYLERYRAKPLASRLIRHARMMDELRQFHEDVDTLFQLLQLAVAGTVVEWKSQWEVDRQAQKHMLAAVVDNDAMILHELRDLRAQMEAMTLLQFELKRRPTPSAPELDDEPNRDHDTELMRRMFKTVVRTSRGSAPIVPPWFLPPDDVAFDPIPFARGSFATVHRGTWGFGTRVVIKRLLVDDSRAGELLPPRFEKEVSLWHTLNHPNVVKMFGASHVSWPPFIVCEDAVGGNLSSYLTRSPSVKQRSMWRLLYEAALGLDYLHRSRVVHGDLKLNNLLVGADGQAKIADFGLSAVRNTLSTSSTAGAGSRGPQSGGLRWRAPECLRRAPTFASDVYSFAMCLIEAVTDEPPFAFLDDESVRENLRHGDIPDQPDDMPQDAWALVLAMTCFEPKERIPMSRVLSKLKTFANNEAQEWTSVNPTTNCRRCGSVLTFSNGDPHPPKCNQCEEAAVDLYVPTPMTQPSAPLFVSESDTTSSNEDWTPVKTANHVETFLNLLQIDDEQRQAQGVRELLLWLITAVDDKTNTERVDKSGVVEALFDHALRSSNYFAKSLAVGALDQLLDQGYRVSTTQIIELKRSVGSTSEFDLSFILRALQTGGDDEKRNVLVLCSCLAATHSDNRDLLRDIGVLLYLVAIIKQPTSELAVYASMALGNLVCRNKGNATHAIQAGVVEPLTVLVGQGLPVARAWAAYTLGCLSSSPDIQRSLQATNAIEAVSSLLTSGDGLQQQWAAYALASLAPDGSPRYIKDSIRVLTLLVERGSSGQKIWAAYALGQMAPFVQQEVIPRVAEALLVVLAADVEMQRLWAATAMRKLIDGRPLTRAAFVRAGSIPHLVAVVEGDEGETRVIAVRTLTALAAHSVPNCDAVVASGVASLLPNMVRTGSRDEKLDAVRLLRVVATKASNKSCMVLASPSTIATLVEVVQSPSMSADVQEQASWTIGYLARANEETRAAIESSGVAATFTQIAATTTSVQLKKWATYALAQLKPPRKASRMGWPWGKRQGGDAATAVDKNSSTTSAR